MTQEHSWAGKEYHFSVDAKQRVHAWVECPRCGQKHLIDDEEEQRRESLFCDTYQVRVPFPNALRRRLQEEAGSIAAPDGPARPGLRWEADLGRKRIGVRYRF